MLGYHLSRWESTRIIQNLFVRKVRNYCLLCIKRCSWAFDNRIFELHIPDGISGVSININDADCEGKTRNKAKVSLLKDFYNHAVLSSFINRFSSDPVRSALFIQRFGDNINLIGNVTKQTVLRD